jgi:hypothetical protein
VWRVDISENILKTCKIIMKTQVSPRRDEVMRTKNSAKKGMKFHLGISSNTWCAHAILKSLISCYNPMCLKNKNYQ